LGSPFKPGTTFKEALNLDNFPLHFEIDASDPKLEDLLIGTLSATHNKPTMYYNFY